MRILVFMSDNRNLETNIDISNYNSLVAAINYEYCKKHNYDFLYYRPYLDDNTITNLYNCIDPNTKLVRHSAWSKLLSTSKALKLQYDYVVYIDSDCIFKDLQKSLEVFIEPYTEKDIIFLNNKPWGNDKPCSGFFICKICPRIIQFVDDWYNFNFNGKKNPCRWEQGALWLMFKEHNIEIVDSWMFREEKGQYLRHVGSNENKIRIPYFTRFIKENDINYTQNICEIKVVEFNTK